MASAMLLISKPDRPDQSKLRVAAGDKVSFPDGSGALATVNIVSVDNSAVRLNVTRSQTVGLDTVLREGDTIVLYHADVQISTIKVESVTT